MSAITTTGESWNNHSFSEVETHLKGYYSKTGHTHSYLPLVGGSLSGAIKYLYGNENTDHFVYFQASDNIEYGLGIRRPASSYGLCFKSGSDYYSVYHEGNLKLKTINGQSVFGTGDISVGGGASGNFLPLTGGTLTGGLNAGGSISVNRSSADTSIYHQMTLSNGYIEHPSDGVLKIGYRGSDNYFVVFDAVNRRMGVCDMNPGYTLEVAGTCRISSYLCIATTDTSYKLNVGGNAYITGNVITSSSIGISTSSPSYKLHVVGDVYATGGVTAASDARLKDVQGDTTLTIEDIANAPSIKFLWKNDHSLGLQAGTLAQYWQGVLPEVVSDKGGELGLQYGVAALISSITTAKKVVNHEERIKQLEDELAKLKAEKS